MNPIIIIPSRLTSVRLPNKPLAEISGVPMIVRVVKQAEKAGIADVVVACAEQEIVDVVEKAGGRAVLTDPDHPSGTDRINEALDKIDPDGNYDIIINVQGDLPTIDPEVIKDVLIPFEFSSPPPFTGGVEVVDITTLAAKIINDDEKDNPNVVKAVVAWEGRTGKALYFTRSKAPAGDGDLYHHIGLYAYTREAIKKFTSLPQSPLEKREKLEQLRALENNMRIEVVLVDTVPFGVDTKEDLKKAESLL